MFKKCEHNKDEGFTTVWMIGFAVLILMVGMVFFQFGVVVYQRQDFVNASQRAADAGATALDEDKLASSDGNIVQLNQDATKGETAVARCEAAISTEAAKSKSKINLSNSGCEVGPDGALISAKVSGEVSLGVISSWLGIPSRTFTVISRSRPTCSDSTATSGKCN